MPYVTEFSLCAAAFIAAFSYGEMLLKRPKEKAVRIARTIARKVRRD